MPAGMREDAQAAWEQWAEVLEPAQVLTQLDAMALELLATAYADWRHAQQQVQETGGEVIEQPPSGRRAKNPWADVRDTEFRNLAMLLKEFGMTPNSRSGIKLPPAPKPKKTPLELMRERGMQQQ